MIKEIKYLLHLVVIFIFFFFSIKFYLSDKYEKTFFRSMNNHDNLIKNYSQNLELLENDTNNIIEYIDNNKNKSKKTFQFFSEILEIKLSLSCKYFARKT